MNKKTAEALKALTKAQNELGSNCKGREEEFSGERLPTPERAVAMCWRCPLEGADNVCRAVVLASKGQQHGVYDGEVFDYWAGLDDTPLNTQ